MHKAFRIPTRHADTLKERVMHPFTASEYRTLEALRGISFEVHAGEFMGIAGRNGCGKTTLLKLIASIYGIDSGHIRVAGRLAPFIELGVGFNPTLNARDNIAINGVMMGLSPGEARRRTDAVIDFAELHEFVELPLKNYSSGMRVRLAFSLMLEADADVLLFDEVLAVGDAAFARKCGESFEAMRSEGRTVLLVTHDMNSLRNVCDRAVLIEQGRIISAGDPIEVANSYLEILAAARYGTPETEAHADMEVAGALRGAARIAEFRLEDELGQVPQSFDPGAPVRLVAFVEAHRDAERPDLRFEIATADGYKLFSPPTVSIGGDDDKLAAGQRVRCEAVLENRLTPGTYVVNCRVIQRGTRSGIFDALSPGPALVVTGVPDFDEGYVRLDCETSVTPDAASPLTRNQA